MIEWPNTLVREIQKERCIFFLGAGASASARDAEGKSPPAWGEFMDSACELVRAAETAHAIRDLIEERKYLVALQAIRDNCHAAEYRNHLDQWFNRRGFKPSKLHEIVYEIDPRIVITTNFDKLYETYWAGIDDAKQGFKVIEYTSRDLSDEIRSDTRLIIKAHGTIDRISEMIFTREQYHRAKRDHGDFYDILRALFLTNTIVFVGCGLEDPDINLLLEDVHITGRAEKQHYALTLKGASNRFLIEDWKKTYNIAVLEYGPNHDALIDELAALRDRVNAEKASETGGVS